MPIARRSFPLVVVTAALFCLPASRVMGQMGGLPATAAAAPPPPAASGPTPPAAVPPPPPRMKTIHRQISGLPLQREYRSRPLITNANATAQERINELLERVPEPMAFSESPLRDVVQRLSEVLGEQVEVNVGALEDIGLDLDTPVTFGARGIKARSILRRILGPLDLAWIVQDEVLLITTKEHAEVNLETRLYLLPCGYDCDAAGVQAVIDLIQGTVAADTWDTVGGPGAIRSMDMGPATQLVISTTHEIHEEVESLLRSLHDQALAEFGGPEDAGGKAPVLRLHHVADPRAREDLAAKLPEVCNASLAQGVDPEARVTVMGESLAVQSRSPEFHALAGQIVRAVRGEKVLDDTAITETVERSVGTGFGSGGIGTRPSQGFCWVARVVYGETDPRWLQFRSWLTTGAPRWLRDIYAARGEAFAGWIEHRPVAKTAVRLLMDEAIGCR